VPQPLVPNPFRSDTQYRRYFHQDVADLSDRELWRELWRVQHALAHDDNAPDWLWDRLQVLLDEQQRRGRARRRHVPKL
jgi:hypothetical protein